MVPLARLVTASINHTHETDEAELLNEYGANGADEILGFDNADDESEASESESDDESSHEAEEEPCDSTMSDKCFSEFQRRLRVDETRRAEANRRPGGIKTQKTNVKLWMVST